MHNFRFESNYTKHVHNLPRLETTEPYVCLALLLIKQRQWKICIHTDNTNKINIHQYITLFYIEHNIFNDIAYNAIDNPALERNILNTSTNYHINMHGKDKPVIKSILPNLGSWANVVPPALKRIKHKHTCYHIRITLLW